ncbi:MAG: hypothetical protein DHS20C13_26230 [Thermodesulfobacteriota bacterium]|nr:MAG: hypothetical protein DHS20C13_26230 [Thermodesulfobacteriota bacterium]
MQCEHLFVLTDGGDCVEECNDFLLDLNFSVTGSNIKYSDKTLCVTSAIDAEEITLD